MTTVGVTGDVLFVVVDDDEELGIGGGVGGGLIGDVVDDDDDVDDEIELPRSLVFELLMLLLLVSVVRLLFSFVSND